MPHSVVTTGVLETRGIKTETSRTWQTSHHSGPVFQAANSVS